MSPTLAARRARRALWVFILVGSTGLVAMLAFGVGALLDLTHEVRATQLEGTPTGQRLLTSADRILDCTNPEGQCYKDSQKRTAQAVGDINRVIVLAAACSVGLDREMSVERRQIVIQECVINRLAQQAAKP